MVGTQTNLDGGFGISKKSSFSDKEAVPQKNLLTSSRLLSSLCLLCCNDLRQFDFTCVCLSKYTACWAGQLPSDAWDCFMTEDGKISMVFISPSKPCPQMVLHVWDRTGSLHCSSSSSSATTNTRFYLSTQWHPYGDALTQHLPALQIVFLGFSPVLHFWIGRRKPRSPSGYPSQDPMTHLSAKRPVGKKYLNNSNDCFLSSQGLLARCCAHLSRALLEGLHLYPWLCTTLAKITLFRIRLKSHPQRMALHRHKQIKWRGFKLWATENYSSDIQLLTHFWISLAFIRTIFWLQTCQVRWYSSSSRSVLDIIPSVLLARLLSQ